MHTSTLWDSCFSYFKASIFSFHHKKEKIVFVYAWVNLVNTSSSAVSADVLVATLLLYDPTDDKVTSHGLLFPQTQL